MKINKNPLVLFVYACLLSLSIFAYSNVNSQASITVVEAQMDASVCHHGQCHATAKSTGNRCKHCVSNSGDYYCWQHK